MKKRKEIIDFLSRAFVVEINKINVQEIEKKYKEAKTFVIRETIFQSIFIGFVFHYLSLVKDIFSFVDEYGDEYEIFYSTLFIMITLTIVVLILLRAINIYALLKYKTKIKKYYHNENKKTSFR
jgi:hypothetical protein